MKTPVVLDAAAGARGEPSSGGIMVQRKRSCL